MTDRGGAGASRIDEAVLSVLLDVRHPLAYLALGPARTFGAEHGLTLNWLPLQVPTLRPPSPPGPDDDRSVRHRRARAEAIAREVATYADVEGLVLRETYRDAPAPAVERAWLWVRERAPERLEDFLEAVFRAYWAVELDPGDADAVARIVDRKAGVAEGFREWAVGQGATTAAALAEELAGRGLRNVPAYVVEGEVFYGRQHLPMIRWLLGGRRGPGPI